MYNVKQLNDMSDEDFDNINIADLPIGDVDYDEEQEEGLTDDTDEEQDLETDGDDLDNSNDDTESEEEEEDAEEGDESTDSEEEEQSEDDEEGDEDTPLDDEVDAAGFYAQVTAEFKANGTTYSVSSPEEVISLMQKGLNYQQKMDAIAPHMGVTKLLEQKGLLNQGAVAFLIDLHDGKPEAIAKLIKDKNIDSYDLGEDKAEAYVATPVSIPSPSALALEEVVKSNEGNEQFAEVISTASTWDQDSQDAILANPNYLNILTEHKANGVYDAIMKEVRHAKDIRMDKTPVLQLYHAIGTQMYKGNGAGADKAQAPVNKKAPVKVTKRTDPELEKKRSILRSTKSTPVTNSPTAVKSAADILSLSDEEFDKIDIEQLMKQHKGN